MFTIKYNEYGSGALRNEYHFETRNGYHKKTTTSFDDVRDAVIYARNMLDVNSKIKYCRICQDGLVMVGDEYIIKREDKTADGRPHQTDDRGVHPESARSDT